MTRVCPFSEKKGDRVSGGRVCHSGMSVTATEVSLKREDEEGGSRRMTDRVKAGRFRPA